MEQNRSVDWDRGGQLQRGNIILLDNEEIQSRHYSEAQRMRHTGSNDPKQAMKFEVPVVNSTLPTWLFASMIWKSCHPMITQWRGHSLRNHPTAPTFGLCVGPSEILFRLQKFSAIAEMLRCEPANDYIICDAVLRVWFSSARSSQTLDSWHVKSCCRGYEKRRREANAEGSPICIGLDAHFPVDARKSKKVLVSLQLFWFGRRRTFRCLQLLLLHCA